MEIMYPPDGSLPPLSRGHCAGPPAALTTGPSQPSESAPLAKWCPELPPRPTGGGGGGGDVSSAQNVFWEL